jgi:mannose-1-phosphate guanylyltransferase
MLVVTAADQVDDVKAQAPGIGVVAEPKARNTAPCILLGTLEALSRDPDAVIAVVPSDQFVAKPDAYAETLRAALSTAAAGRVVTIGLRPTRPETGFGYIEVGEPLEGAARRIARFVEKPDRATAERYLASGSFLWNSGMFFFSARRMLELYAKHMPELYALYGGVYARFQSSYAESPSISIDYGVMEKLGSDDLAVVPAEFGWSDVGSWAALAEVARTDTLGNAIVGETVTVDSLGNHLYAAEGQIVTCVGVKDLVIVAADGAVLVLPKERAQDVREIVALVKESWR